MIAKSSILNPIRFFNDPVDSYWQVESKNGPDRGNFARYFPENTAVTCYFDADAPLTTIELRQCGTNALIGSFVCTPLGGTKYSAVINIGPQTKRVYLNVTGSAIPVVSELLEIVPITSYYFTKQTVVQYKNIKEFAGLPANTLVTGYWDITFWQSKNPQTYQDIEITPGEFTRLTNHIHRVMKLETNYYPAYLHEMIQVVLGLDYVLINNKEWIMRNDYSYEFGNRHYALAKGTIELTERKSILRNTI